MTGAADPPVDLNHLRELLGDDPEMIQDLYETYLDSCPAYLSAIEESLASGDPDSARSNAHALKGSSGNIGAAAVAELARVLEGQAGEGAVAEAQDTFAKLRSEYQRVQSFLTKEGPG